MGGRSRCCGGSLVGAESFPKARCVSTGTWCLLGSAYSSHQTVGLDCTCFLFRYSCLVPLFLLSSSCCSHYHSKQVPKQECGHTPLLVYKGDIPPLQGPRWPQPSDKPNFCHSVVFILITPPLPWHFIPHPLVRAPPVLAIFLGKVCHLRAFLPCGPAMQCVCSLPCHSHTRKGIFLLLSTPRGWGRTAP